MAMKSEPLCQLSEFTLGLFLCPNTHIVKSKTNRRRFLRWRRTPGPGPHTLSLSPRVFFPSARSTEVRSSSTVSSSAAGRTAASLEAQKQLFPRTLAENENSQLLADSSFSGVRSRPCTLCLCCPALALHNKAFPVESLLRPHGFPRTCALEETPGAEPQRLRRPHDRAVPHIKSLKTNRAWPEEPSAAAGNTITRVLQTLSHRRAAKLPRASHILQRPPLI